MLRISQGNDEDISSYLTIIPEGVEYDKKTGYFDCGNYNEEIEGVEILIPEDGVFCSPITPTRNQSNCIKCTDCTLQLGYHVPDIGEIYQCSDFTPVLSAETSACKPS